jgi:hypothetical protein
MRVAGHSFVGISKLTPEHLGYRIAPSTVAKFFYSDLDRFEADGVERMRKVENERLDYYLTKLAGAINAGDEKAIARAVSISERRAKLNGLDAPVVSTMNVTGDVPEELLVMAAEAREARIAAREGRKELEEAVDAEIIEEPVDLEAFSLFEDGESL